MGRSGAARSPSARASPPPSGKPKSKKDAAVIRPDDYSSDGVKDNDVFLLPGSDFQILIGVTILAAIVRLFRIYQPTSVVFDEVHFGGFASKYIKGRFFMDVHPPLAKMLIALTGFLAGFDGEFDFKEIGKDYLEPGVPYVAMRLFPAICGILLVPTMYLTLKAANCRTSTALMGAGLIIFENGLLTQARLILLDSPLIAATAFTALAFTAFSNQHEQGPSKAFTPSWWFWLFTTGLGLGITVSIKWVGLFTIAWVGSLTLIQLWVLLGDTKTVTVRVFSKHFMARVFCLIIVPATFYMGMFGIHFLCLVNPGDGDGFMSSEFQATLNSKAMQDVPVDVLLGSSVTIRHVNTQGGYLHSHPLMYPTGSKQQQVTLYPHKDHNNAWLLENQTQPLDSAGEPINGTDAWNKLPESGELPYIVDGTVLRLFHPSTSRRLHSHDVRPPVTEADWQNEVSAYGYEGFDGDANDYFRVEIVKKQSDGALAKERVRTIETKFRLVHVMTGCVLFSHKVKLPDWASEQQEVTCARGGSLPNSVWYVESNEHPLLGADAEKVNYRRPGFFGKFLELQQVMWKTNAGLVESHAYDSRPSAWPILRRGINFWGKQHRQIYLIGNPFVWWSSTAAIVVYVLFKGIAVLRWQRSCGDYNNATFKRFDYEIGTSVLGWAFHYFPFYLMERQLFLHHYFPALFFAIMAFCQVYDFATARFGVFRVKSNPLIGKAGAMTILAVATVVFTLYAPLAYGNTWTKSECKRVQLFSSWDWDCNTFLDSYQEYEQFNMPSVAAVPTSPGAAPVDEQPAPIADIPIAGGEHGQIPIEQAQQQQQQQQQQQPEEDKPQEVQQEQQQSVAEPEPLHTEPPAPPVALAQDGNQNQRILSRDERVEYRDQDGNILDPEQVEALRGKVEFKTRYETRTRLVDEAGNEILDESAPVAPPHPDVEGVDQSTKQSLVADDALPQSADPSVEGEREKDQTRAKPASEGSEATQRREAEEAEAAPAAAPAAEE
ncbi:dolichyl-phosphate-mannose-protein mannosyltransferase [Sporothrix brasiliensis 5110]|uniref:Dolichyl-phosphate-mannose--protein mannosyltransferase n=1 Tax=Sporothrix brasiliensis 5110 TaxID=1398154 RepID=A0A0C2IKQ8_9PEZI|nr:dolichyl-phosphate-mannose-protein mannosyltransferase [Sporothrix brasiliensis 5110]KIH87555.1 dolichyl-phosphate-mannose-protein mannosyltransferase [Sporothrix brasiliensis 5110]